MSDASGKSEGVESGAAIVGRYEIVREIGRGGMAVVYLARQLDLDRLVALKELSSFHAGSPELAQRFLRESRLAGSLSHPNIVTVHTYFEHAGTPYIAMELLPRGSLRPHMGRLSLAQFAGVMEGVLAALAHAETVGIVHRDLKPENIMVTGDGRVKIADFGIAKATQSATGTEVLTATGSTVGTPSYMAPEQVMEGDIGPRADLYSVGIIAYEELVGHGPFHDADTALAVLMRHVNEPVVPAATADPAVDRALSDWIDGLLVKDPAARTRSASEAWDSLEEIILGLLGPRWRREARLTAEDPPLDMPKPLAPALFEGGRAAMPPRAPAPKPDGTAPPAGPGAPTTPPSPARTATPTTPATPAVTRVVGGSSTRVPTPVRTRVQSAPESAPAPTKARRARISLPIALGLMTAVAAAIVAVLVLDSPASKRPPGAASTVVALDPIGVAQAWLEAYDAGDDRLAASYWAPPAVVTTALPSRRYTLATPDDILRHWSLAGCHLTLTGPASLSDGTVVIHIVADANRPGPSAMRCTSIGRRYVDGLTIRASHIVALDSSLEK